jgi:hypothetical protein
MLPVVGAPLEGEVVEVAVAELAVKVTPCEERLKGMVLAAQNANSRLQGRSVVQRLQHFGGHCRSRMTLCRW